MSKLVGYPEEATIRSRIMRELTKIMRGRDESVKLVEKKFGFSKHKQAAVRKFASKKLA